MHKVPVSVIAVKWKRGHAVTTALIDAPSIYLECKSMTKQIGTERAILPHRVYVDPHYLCGQRQGIWPYAKYQKSIHCPSELPPRTDSSPSVSDSSHKIHRVVNRPFESNILSEAEIQWHISRFDFPNHWNLRTLQILDISMVIPELSLPSMQCVRTVSLHGELVLPLVYGQISLIVHENILCLERGKLDHYEGMEAC